MATVVEKLVGELKWDTNRGELAKARNDVDKLKAASKLLEEEQRKSTKTTTKMRESLVDLRTQLEVGKISQTEYKKRVMQVRLSMQEEANAARRVTSAMKELKTVTTELTRRTREHERAEDKAAKTAERHAKVLAKNAAKQKANSLSGRFGAAMNKRASGGFIAAAGATAVGNLASNAATSSVNAIGGALSDSFDKAVRFESAMADVAKVVDGLKTPTGQITEEYTKLSNELKTLSTRIAVTPDGLAEMAAAAGSAGIKGAELSRFVEDAAKTMVAFDITSEEAGNGLAKLRANLGLNQDEVMGLAGTMNHLSNSMASTAAEVLDATLRVGAVGKAANISGQEVAGFTSAMISAGATSEIAATATKNMILSMAAGTAATRRQREAFAKLGLNSEDVAKQFTGSAESRMAVMRKLLDQLGKLSNADRAATSMQLFGRESLGPIASLTTNVKAFEEAMALAKDEVAGAASVQKEYDVRSKTTANAIQLLSNNFDVLKINIGEGMTPALSRVIADMTEFLGIASDSGQTIGETLGGAIERAWKALKEFIGPADEIPDKIAAIVEKASNFASVAIEVVTVLGSVVEALGGVGTAALVLAAAGGPFALAAAAGVTAGIEIANAWNGAEHAMNQMQNTAAKHRAKEEQAKLAAQQKEIDQESKFADEQGQRSKRLATLQARYEAATGNNVKSSRQAAAFGQAVRGDSRLLGGGTAEDRLANFERIVQQKEAGETGGGVDRMARFKQLDRNRKHLKPSEKKEYDTLSKELDVAKTTGSGKAKKHKPDSAYEADVAGEIDRLAKESGKRAGIKAAMAKKNRREQFEAAATAEAETKQQLRSRIDAGGTLPGQFHHNMLQSAGFGDVAGRGTPPPLAVTIIDVKPMTVEVAFTGPINTDMREVREGVRRIWREEVPQMISQGLREARMQPVY